MKSSPGTTTPTQAKSFSRASRPHFRHPIDARRSGVETIYQDLALADNLDVVANIYLGREVKRRYFGRLILERSTDRRAGDRGSPRLRCRPGFPTLIEPMRAFRRPAPGGRDRPRGLWDAQLVMMDEPTGDLGVAR